MQEPQLHNSALTRHHTRPHLSGHTAGRRRISGSGTRKSRAVNYHEGPHVALYVLFQINHRRRIPRPELKNYQVKTHALPGLSKQQDFKFIISKLLLNEGFSWSLLLLSFWRMLSVRAGPWFVEEQSMEVSISGRMAGCCPWVGATTLHYTTLH